MRNKGFSLVELSIVLVILGLLAGGILTGQSLIHAAELRSVTTDFQKYQTAVMTFRDKYFALPGDMRNATNFWGAAHVNPTTCLTTLPIGKETCSGDGDGQIGPGSGPATATNEYAEQTLAWKHLANADLIEGSYTGISANASSWLLEPGINIPKSRSGAGSYSLNYRNVPNGTGWVFPAVGTILTFSNNFISPSDAWNIDKKIDDGHPVRGLFGLSGRSLEEPYGKYCATSDDATSAEYDLQKDASGCSLQFYIKKDF